MACTVLAGWEKINTVYSPVMTVPDSSNSGSGMKVTASWLRGCGEV